MDDDHHPSSSFSAWSAYAIQRFFSGIFSFFFFAIMKIYRAVLLTYFILLKDEIIPTV